MKIALVHDYLREYGGAERVVEVFHEIWPKAPLYTSFVDWKALGKHAERFKHWNIKTSPVADNIVIKKFHSPLRFLAPIIWNSFDLSGYDVVVSSSGWFMCRGVKMIHADKLSPYHVCYIHHPPRNLYGYTTGSNLQKYKLVRIYAAFVNFFLRQYDFNTAQQVDYFIANSKETARRVQKFYRRDSQIIYPPVTIKKLTFDTQNKESYFLTVGRLTYSKRVDLAITVCNRLQLPLKIVGVGKEEGYLRSIAGSTIEFLGGVSDEELSQIYLKAKALIFCALDEDFGMVPVESMSFGTPVIALAQGGVKETVIQGKTGMLFLEPTVESLEEAIKDFEKSNKDWSKDCIHWVQQFSKERFVLQIKEIVKKVNL